MGNLCFFFFLSFSFLIFDLCFVLQLVVFKFKHCCRFSLSVGPKIQPGEVDPISQTLFWSRRIHPRSHFWIFFLILRTNRLFQKHFAGTQWHEILLVHCSIAWPVLSFQKQRRCVNPISSPLHISSTTTTTMAVCANSDLYPPFPHSSIPEESGPSSEEGSGLHSPIFSQYTPHGDSNRKSYSSSPSIFIFTSSGGISPFSSRTYQYSRCRWHTSLTFRL